MPDDGDGAVWLALCAAMLAVAVLAVLCSWGADECARLYCAPGDPAIEAYKAAEREVV